MKGGTSLLILKKIVNSPKSKKHLKLLKFNNLKCF